MNLAEDATFQMAILNFLKEFDLSYWGLFGLVAMGILLWRAHDILRVFFVERPKVKLKHERLIKLTKSGGTAKPKPPKKKRKRKRGK